MHFLIVALGTHGDVLPLITLGRHLRARTHRVTLLAPVIYGSTIEHDDIGFVPLSNKDEYERSVRDIPLLNSRYRALYLLRHAISWNKIVYLTARSLRGPDLVMVAADRSMLWADFNVHFHLKVPVVRLEFDPPRLRNVIGEIGELPHSRVQKVLIAKIEAQWRRGMKDQGLPIGRGGMTRLKRSGLRDVPRVCLYPPWLTNPRRSRSVHDFGFLPPANFGEKSCDPPFKRLSDKKLIVFVAGTLGMTKPWSDRFFAVSAEICERLNCEGLLLGGDKSPAIQRPTLSITWRSFLPLTRILSHASVIVHHGGIGTTAVAMEHGIPQLIIPRFGWQPSTAERFRRLGVCTLLHERTYTVERASNEIQRILNDDSFRKRALALVQQFNPGDVPVRICKFLEDWSNARRGAQTVHTKNSMLTL